MKSYQYKECGLDNVFIEGIAFIVDDAGDNSVTIPNITALHRAISKAIIGKPTAMVGRELRFLRSEMGMTQAELAQFVHTTSLTISRWERGESPVVDANADSLIRLMAIEKLGIDTKASIQSIAEWAGKSTDPNNAIIIEGNDNGSYEPKRAA